MRRLRTIVYVSNALVPFSESDLERLLLESRANNEAAGVTGVLLYSGGNFMQCFEGPEDGVADTYARIRASRRHGGLIELLDEPVATRSFPAWQMGFQRTMDSQLLTLSSAAWRRQLAHAPAEAEPAGLALLRHFWAQDLR